MIEVLYIVSGIIVGGSIVRYNLKQKYETKIDVIENEANIKINSLKTQNNLNIEHYEDKIKTEEDAKEQMKQEFEKLSNKIFESVKQESNSNLTLLLKPFKEQLESFGSRVNNIYTNETRQRSSLLTEIKNLKNQINADTFTTAKSPKIKDNTRDDWDEMDLSKILEQTGLTQGKEYSVQGSFTDKSGKILRPDVILHLPENKDIVIDSKVPMLSYLNFINSTDKEKKEIASNEFMKSLETHIQQLSNKKYKGINEMKTLDFTLMFIPIEGAFMLASSKDNSLFKTAFDNNIMLVSPSTFFVTLRIIKNIWQYEHKSENAQFILNNAVDLYDKFNGFIADMENIGKYIDKTKKSYETSLNKLSAGKGNLVKRAEELKNLGIKSKKNISQNIIEKNEEE